MSRERDAALALLRRVLEQREEAIALLIRVLESDSTEMDSGMVGGLYREISRFIERCDREEAAHA